MAALRIAEFYAGIGGFHYALKESGVRGDIVASMDINTNTRAVYTHNFPQTLHLNRNICGLTARELDKLGANVFFLSPPCQPFTRQGNRLDSMDRRTDSFFHLMHTLSEMQYPPQYLLMENVQGFEISQTRDIFVGILKSLGYTIQEFLLSPIQFGIPNSRLRFYLLAKKKPLKFALIFGEELSGPQRNIGKLMEFVSLDLEFREVIKLNPSEQTLRTSAMASVQDLSSSMDQKSSNPETKLKDGAELTMRIGELSCNPISDYLEELPDSKLVQFLVPEKLLEKYAIALDIVQPNCKKSCCFTKGYGKYAVGTGSILQHSLDYEELKKAFEEFEILRKQTADSKCSAECLKALNLRYFTPREVANLMCFPADFGFPSTLTDKQCYKALGNSLNIRVVSILIKYLFS